jgi:TRAP-type C4-dicarboxylate transport system substrate-binding protein
MRTNRPQVAALTLSGLGDIDADFGVFGIPYFFESDGEARHVLERLTERLERKLVDRGLILLGWGHGGWAHIFSADPVNTLEQLQATKLYVPAGDDDALQWYKASGFQPVPLEIGDVMMGLNTGMIDAYPVPPIAALVFQWYREVSHMLDVPLAPVFSATVITERAWRGLDAADQIAIRESAKAAEERMWAEVPQQDREAVSEMEKRGLAVTTVDASTARSFRALADELTLSWRGQLVPADVYDHALRERNVYRAGNGDQ